MRPAIACLILLTTAHAVFGDVINPPRPATPPTHPRPKKPLPPKPDSWSLPSEPARTAFVGVALSLVIVTVGLRSMRRQNHGSAL